MPSLGYCRWVSLCFFLVVTLGPAASVRALVEVGNDGFQTGDTASFQLGFVSGEEAASRLTPPSPGSWKIEKIRLLFGGATTVKTVGVVVYNEVGTTAPGTVLYMGDHQMTGSNDQFSEVDLSAANIEVTGDFRVSIRFQHTGAPSVSRDLDGILPGRNFIKASSLGWVKASTFGVMGDWIVRADLSGGGGAADAGPSSADAGPSSADAGPGNADARSSDVDAGVGPTCDLNSDCLAGQYCSETTNECSFDCRVATDCASNEACDELGRCVATGGGGCGCSSGGHSSPATIVVFGLLLLLLLRRRKGVASREA